MHKKWYLPTPIDTIISETALSIFALCLDIHENVDLVLDCISLFHLQDFLYKIAQQSYPCRGLPATLNMAM